MTSKHWLFLSHIQGNNTEENLQGRRVGYCSSTRERPVELVVWFSDVCSPHCSLGSHSHSMSSVNGITKNTWVTVLQWNHPSLSSLSLQKPQALKDPWPVSLSNWDSRFKQGNSPGTHGPVQGAGRGLIQQIKRQITSNTHSVYLICGILSAHVCLKPRTMAELSI